MKKIELGQTLTILANLGVIVGIAFVAVELNQTNRIASYTAANARRSQAIDINTSIFERPEIYAKLRAGDAQLTPSEQVQALMLARMLMNSMQDTEFAYDSGLVSEQVLQSTLESVSVAMEEVPGLDPFFAYLLGEYVVDNEKSQVAREVAEVLRNKERD